MNLENKRAGIIELLFFELSKVEVMTQPGSNRIKLIGPSISFKTRDAEFIEGVTPAENVSQQFNAVLTDISINSSSMIRRSISLPGIWVMIYSNGERRAVGTDQFPVRMSVEESGRPAVFKLSFKRTSPEPAKFL